MLKTKMTFEKPKKPVINFIGFPFSFSGNISLTIAYKMAPDMKE